MAKNGRFSQTQPGRYLRSQQFEGALMPEKYETSMKKCERQSSFRAIRWLDFPAHHGVPLLSHQGARPHLLVVHLFSGHRREGDFHAHLQR